MLFAGSFFILKKYHLLTLCSNINIMFNILFVPNIYNFWKYIVFTMFGSHVL